MTDIWTPESALATQQVEQILRRGLLRPSEYLRQAQAIGMPEQTALNVLWILLDSERVFFTLDRYLRIAETERADRLEAQMERVGDLWHDRWEAAAQKAAQYEAALRFYADPANYVLAGEPAATGELHAWAPPVLGDDGERARAALKGKSVRVEGVRV